MLVDLTRKGFLKVMELWCSGFAKEVDKKIGKTETVTLEFENDITLEDDEFVTSAIIGPGDTVKLDSITITLPPDTGPAPSGGRISLDDPEKFRGKEFSYVIFDEVADIDWEKIKEVEMAKFSSKVADLLRSNTSTIESAVIGSDKIEDMEKFTEIMEDLLLPIMKRNRFWATTGPVKLSAYDEKKNKWKMLSCLGGERLEYKGMRVGNRDGLLFQWFSSDIAGISEEVVIETSVPKHGHMIAAYDDEKNEVTTDVLRTILADEVGTYDLMEKAEEIRLEAEKIKKAEKAKKIEEQSEHYGGGFGSWA